MFYNRERNKKIAGQMGVFAGTERQCTEDEHDDEDENDSQTSEFALTRTRKLSITCLAPAVAVNSPRFVGITIRPRVFVEYRAKAKLLRVSFPASLGIF
jgi:hypothetical protein